MFGRLWNCLMLITVDLGQHLPPTGQQTILPWPDIMIGTIKHRENAPFVFQVREPRFGVKLPDPYITRQFWSKRSKVEVANWASGGSKSPDRFQEKSKYWIFWNSVRGVLEGFGLIQKWFVLAQTDVGRVWKCLCKSKRSKVVVSYLAKEGRKSGWKQSGSRSEASGDAWDGFGW